MPEEVIRRRYRSSIDNSMKLYAPQVDLWWLYDNQATGQPLLVASCLICRQPHPSASFLHGADKDFTLTQVQERWSDDVCAWMHEVVRTWVQRCKRRKLTCEDRGVHVLLETQDDHGYYRYEFDVLPGK